MREGGVVRESLYVLTVCTHSRKQSIFPGQVEYLKGINTISVPRNIGYGRIRFLFFFTPRSLLF
jgi:hypothetical protein